LKVLITPTFCTNPMVISRFPNPHRDLVRADHHLPPIQAIIYDSSSNKPMTVTETSGLSMYYKMTVLKTDDETYVIYFTFITD